MENVFTLGWLLVGHESLIPKPNDYFGSRMGTVSVILTRNKQGEILVLLNSCTHRGLKVCGYHQGNSAAFTCPYHGWSYSTDRDRSHSWVLSSVCLVRKKAMVAISIARHGAWSAAPMW